MLRCVSNLIIFIKTEDLFISCLEVYHFQTRTSYTQLVRARYISWMRGNFSF